MVESGVQPWDWQAPPTDEALIHAVRAAVETELVEAYQIVDKLDRQQRVRDLRVQTIAQVTAQAPDRWTALVIRPPSRRWKAKLSGAGCWRVSRAH